MKRFNTGLLLAAAVLIICHGFPSYGKEEKEGFIEYTVSFVDAADHDNRIFNSQQGQAPEGTAIHVSFPKQIIGADGHIWRAEADSPQEFLLYQAGRHKYYVEYRQGEKIAAPEDPDREGRERLARWLERAWKADCLITGQGEEEGSGVHLKVENESRNNERIKNLVSMIQDARWHSFYMIGKNYVPQTLVIGTSFDAEYSAVMEDRFKVGKDSCTVLRISVRRNWNAENCTHNWELIIAGENDCLKNGQETYCCKKCRTEETVILPASGHYDSDGDSLCDRCKKRAFPAQIGDRIRTVLQTESGEKELVFRCLDLNYRGSGNMLYLSEETLGEDITGICFTESDYNGSPLRKYFNLAFANNISAASALQPIERPDADGRNDYAALLSTDEYEAYAEMIEAGNACLLRTVSGGAVYAVDPEGGLCLVPAAESRAYGVRPFILLKSPETGEKAELSNWKTGDIQMRQIGQKLYRFRCVDEDYSDNLDGHRSAALFLCDSVIRADTCSSMALKEISFGPDNNYKSSRIREWLAQNSVNSSFNLEPVLIGINTAYTGGTAAGTMEQLDGSLLAPHDIGFQLMQDRLFCLSVEEALRYRKELWRFGSQQNNPAVQISPYSQGYYLRTPYYAEDHEGRFYYSDHVYAVDLVNGNIHPVPAGSQTYGLRPAFAVPQAE